MQDVNGTARKKLLRHSSLINVNSGMPSERKEK